MEYTQSLSQRVNKFNAYLQQQGGRMYANSKRESTITRLFLTYGIWVVVLCYTLYEDCDLRHTLCTTVPFLGDWLPW